MIKVTAQVGKGGKRPESCGYQRVVSGPIAASGSLLEMHSLRVALSEVLERVEPKWLFLANPFSDSGAQ